MTSNYENLPQELLDQLSKKQTDNLTGRLIEIFRDGEQRNIDEILIDYWKKYKKVVKRTTMASALAYLTKNEGSLRRCGKGVYVINSEETGV